MPIKQPYISRRKISGFSLVEMAIVLAIVTLLLAGLLPTISSQIEQQRRNETRKQLEEIRAALIGYAVSQPVPRLPCPAKPDIPTGTTYISALGPTLPAGAADCAQTTGVFPWVTLGTSETDAWGRRFTYSVASSVAGGDFTTSFNLTSTGNLNVLNQTAGIVIASGVPAVVVSHGVNGLGARMPDGSQLLPASTDADELKNSTANTAIFVSHDNTTTFDDLVVWVSPNTLFNRLVTAGKLP